MVQGSLGGSLVEMWGDVDGPTQGTIPSNNSGCALAAFSLTNLIVRGHQWKLAEGRRRRTYVSISSIEASHPPVLPSVSSSSCTTSACTNTQPLNFVPSKLTIPRWTTSR